MLKIGLFEEESAKEEYETDGIIGFSDSKTVLEVQENFSDSNQELKDGGLK
jgi:hypothetical protein